jgi:hypothetical protein
MSKVPSSSTSKNFIQMNKAKISSMVSKPRTKSQELPELSKPAKPSFQPKSKNPGGPSANSSISKNLKNPVKKSEESKVPSVVSSSLPLQSFSPVKTANVFSPARDLVKNNFDDLIESAQNMIDLCEKALTPARMSQAKMSTIEEGTDSSAGASPDLVINFKESVDEEREGVTLTTEGNKYSQKTPESRYQESDIHQILYSASQSDGSNSKAVQNHNQDLSPKDTMMNNPEYSPSKPNFFPDTQIKNDSHPDQLSHFGYQDPNEEEQAKINEKDSEIFPNMFESNLKAVDDEKSSQSSEKKIMTRKSSRRESQESQNEKNSFKVASKDDSIHFHTDDELLYAESSTPDDKKNDEVMSQSSSRSLGHFNLDSNGQPRSRNSRKKSFSSKSRSPLPEKIPEALSEDSPLKSNQSDAEIEDVKKSPGRLNEDDSNNSRVKTKSEGKKLRYTKVKPVETQPHQRFEAKDNSQDNPEDHVRYHTRKYYRQVADKEKSEFSQTGKVSHKSSSSDEDQEDDLSLRRSKRLARKKDEGKKKNDEGNFKRKKSKKHAGHKKKIKY